MTTAYLPFPGATAQPDRASLPLPDPGQQNWQPQFGAAVASLAFLTSFWMMHRLQVQVGDKQSGLTLAAGGLSSVAIPPTARRACRGVHHFVPFVNDSGTLKSAGSATVFARLASAAYRVDNVSASSATIYGSAWLVPFSNCDSLGELVGGLG